MLNELWKERLLEAHLLFLKMDRKRFFVSRIVYGFMLALLFLLVVMMIGKHIWFIGVPVAFFIGWKVAYLRLLLSKQHIDVKNSFLFPQFLQSFMALLVPAGNVYQALKQSIAYTTAPINEELEKLVRQIEKGNHREDYIAFADYIGSSEAYMIMNMIHQFTEQGIKEESLRELEQYIQRIQENKVNELIEQKMAAAEKYAVIPILIALFFLGGFAMVIFLHYMSNVMTAIPQ